MSLSDVFLRRPVLSSVCSLLILLMGTLSLLGLPIEAMPNIGPPTVLVTTTFPGSDALILEKTVTAPLEEQINGVPGMDYIASNSDNSGNCAITVFFKPGTDIDGAETNVLNRVQTALAQLPDAVNKQGVTVQATSSTYLLIYSLTSDGRFSSEFLNGLAQDQLIYPLSRADGVAQVVVHGSAPPAYRLWLNPFRLARYNLSPQTVMEALRQNNVVQPGGALGGLPARQPAQTAYPLIIDGTLETLEQFNRLPIARAPNGSVIHLSDVGYAEYGRQNYNFSALNVSNGMPSVAFGVVPLPGANALTTSAAAQQVLKQFEAGLPQGAELRKVFDTADYVASAISNAQQSLADALVLVLLIIFLFLQDWRATMVPALAMPISLLGAMTLMAAAGFSINVLTLLGIILATGLVVDDAIVVVEAVSERIEAGQPPLLAASQAMQVLVGPILATALVLLAIFLPVSFFPGPTGVIYRQFALTIVFALVISTFNAITGKPVQAASLLTGEPPVVSARLYSVVLPLLLGGYGLWRGGWSLALPLALLAWVAGARLPWIFAGFNRLLARSAALHQRLLQRLLPRHRLLSGLLALATVATGLVFALAPSGFVPAEDQDYIMGIIQLPAQASLQATIDVSRRVQKILHSYPFITSGQLMSGEGFNGATPYQGTFRAGLLPIDQRPDPRQSSQALVADLNRQFAAIHDARVIAQMPPAVAGYSAQGGLQFQLNDLSGGRLPFGTLLAQARQLIASAKASGLYSSLYTQFLSDAPVWRLEMNRERLRSLDIDYDEAAATVSTLLGGTFVNQTYEGIEYRQVYVQAEGDARREPDDLSAYYITNRSGQQIPLSTIASLRLDSAPPVINHFNLNRTVLIQGDTAPGKSSNGGLQQLVRSFQQLRSPQLGMDFSSLSRAQAQIGNQTALVFLLGVVVAFLVLAGQYGSYRDPLITLATVPLGILGGLLLLLARGLDNNVFAQVGLLTLVGLAAKNGILIVSLANTHLQEGLAPAQAALEATRSRFRPILMTSIAALSGFFPLVIATGAGQISQRSLGAVIFGGLLVSTLTSLFLVPAVYTTVKTLGSRKVTGSPPPGTTAPEA
ncbi:MAG: efflux RND transporter permease subunit [Cyanobacteriota bacterium]|nr:efflux RND transporter permease subunit [Cyanobacteriota bacterium]